MKRTLIKDLRDKQTARICGFVSKNRKQKKRDFLIVQDHTGLLQILIEHEDNPELSKISAELTEGSTIQVIGDIIANPSVKLGGIEMIPKIIKVETIAKTMPIDKNSSLDVAMDYRWISLRDPKNALIFQAQTVLEAAMREYWLKSGFWEMHSPKLMGTASESGSELFSLEYFDGKTAYLSQSPQFYKQMAMSAGYPGVFEIGPVFRANPSFTSRHDTEFTSVDTEIAWVDSHEDVMKYEENWIYHMFSKLKAELGNRILEEYGIEIEVPELPFPRVTLKEAKEIIKSEGYESPKKGDLDPDDEKIICRYFKEKTKSEFVFVTDYPIAARPFYHMRHEEDASLTKSYDLLYKGLEITTGAQREHRPEILKQQILEKQKTEKDDKLMKSLENYIKFFEYGAPPHGGFGFGLTRVLMKIFDLQNVRQVTYLYRGPKRLTP